MDVFRSFNARQIIYNAVASDAEFLDHYERLVKECIVPHLIKMLAAHSPSSATHGDREQPPPSSPAHATTHPEKRVFYYQYPPSLRLQPGPSSEHGRTHRDAEYGHQPGELNFWMPLSRRALTQTSLRVESAPGSNDFHPLDVEYGEIGQFHGTLCHHHAPRNPSMYTRVSLDFRIGVEGHFDPAWQLEGIKAQHGRRQVEM